MIKKARGRFAAMAATYSLGVFNDNFFKQAAMLIAVGAGLVRYQGYATVIFTLPYLLFAAQVGWVSDRFAKRHVVISSKVVELVAMLIGAAGMLTGNWFLIFTMIAVMGMQSSIFSPALNGSIPELYPAAYVVRANAILKVTVTGSILAGFALAGAALDRSGQILAFPAGRMAVALAVVSAALVGVVISLGVPHRPAAAPRMRFPWRGPLDTLKTLAGVRSDKLLTIAVTVNTLFWFIASLQILLLNPMGLQQLGMSEGRTSLLITAELLGVAAGGLIAGRIAYGRRWYGVLPPASMVLGVLMCFMGLLPLVPTGARGVTAFALLVVMGMAGGALLVPVESFIQVRPRADIKGSVIAAANFAVFTGILLSGPASNFLNERVQPTTGFFICGLFMLAVSLWLTYVWNISRSRRHPLVRAIVRRGDALFDLFLRIFVKCALALRYRVKVDGLDEVASRGTSGILFLPNHPAFIDPFIVLSILGRDFRPASLADKDQIDRFFIRRLAGRAGARPIPDASRYPDAAEKIEQALRECIEGLKAGENLLFYPAGHLVRSRYEDLGGKSALEKIVREVPDVRIVLVRTRGLWGSIFSRARGRAPVVTECLRKAAWSLLASFIFFAPKRRVTVELREPNDFPRHGSRQQMNRYLENFYNDDAPPNTYVPYTLWERGGPRAMPEPATPGRHADLSTVSATVRETVRSQLEEMTGMADFDESSRLGRDLGLDSLAIVDLVTWLEQEFAGVQIAPDALETVGDVMLAAAGLAGAVADGAVERPGARWFEAGQEGAVDGATITEAFLVRAAAAPGRAIVADQRSGVKTYLDLITGIMIFRKRLQQEPGRYMGIMLPASVAADIVYLAVLFAGKTPVMLNWTTGRRGMNHAVDMLDIDTIITAGALIERIEFQQGSLGALKRRMLFLEEFVKTLSPIAKLRAWLAARLSWRALRHAEVSKTAVILFTSGSESTPKAVPLSHENILANIRDVLSVIDVRGDDSMAGIFPPFHSYGLTCTMILPLVSGLRVFHHPNPTDGPMIARLVEAYRATLLLGTPSFLRGIVRRGGADLSSLRLIVTGAEKCPKSLYKALQERCPAAIVIEGYGASECSPVISVNDPAAPVPFTIGRVLPSLEYVILSPESKKPVKPGEEGVLMVRGESVFDGYLDYEGPSPFVEYDGRQWYSTGDIVRERNGVLEFAGRLKRFAKVGGEMISLPAIEEVIAERFVPDDAQEPQVAVEAFERDERPRIVLFATIDIERSAANNALREEGFSALHSIHRVVRVDELPLLGTGKTDYRSLADLLD